MPRHICGPGQQVEALPARDPEGNGVDKRFRVVFFDAANTLLYPDPPVGELYARTARKYGVDVTAADVQAQFRRSWEVLQIKSTEDPVRYGVGEADGRRWWQALVAETFRPLGLPQPFEVFFDELYRLFADPDVWRVYPEVFDVLQVLRAQGLTLGVLSNWDIRLGPLLEGLKLMPYFDHVVLSAVVGWEKPRYVGMAHNRPIAPSLARYATCYPSLMAVICSLPRTSGVKTRVRAHADAVHGARWLSHGRCHPPVSGRRSDDEARRARLRNKVACVDGLEPL
jgi:putative hydrolase of the HAD superfamily